MKKLIALIMSLVLLLSAFALAETELAEDWNFPDGSEDELLDDDDGVTGQWQYVNSELSGNSATISLTLDGETLYTSKALKPGEALESITLEKPLAPGAYKALAVSTVYDKSGEKQLVTRVPVTLNVAAE